LIVALPFTSILVDIRHQQLKEVDQLDGWLRDGSAAYVAGLCEWGR